MCKTCQFFNVCGGCKYDFASPTYRDIKQALLRDINITTDPIWIPVHSRRRADFAFAGGHFGLFERRSKNIVSIDNCPLLCDEINNIIPFLQKLPWNGSGACLVTLCDNGIDVAITSDVPYFSPEFRHSTERLPVIRISWNGRIIRQSDVPVVSFDGHPVEYPIGAFLQPTIISADILRKLVLDAVQGFNKIADLFCGLGNFTFATNATGFDIVGTGIKRDLFKSPLTLKMLEQYDCVIMDPPRAGADAQSRILSASNVKRIVYVSCNPETFKRDSVVLQRGGYSIKQITPIDHFIGSLHWELFSVFEK